MDAKKAQAAEGLYPLLGTMGEALEYLSRGEDGTLREQVRECRRQVTAVLGGMLPGTLEHRVLAGSLPDGDWLRTAYHILGEMENPFQPQNACDRDFLQLLEYIWSHSGQELVGAMKRGLGILKKRSPETWRGFVSYFSRFPLWGTLDPAKGDYDTFRRRAAVLKQHSYDFLWLYCRLEDYLSRRTLYAVLRNWALWDLAEPGKVKSIFPDYWEPDLFPDNKGDVLVDVGAFTGDSIAQYVQMYGTGYEKIYAYEISEDSCRQLEKNVEAMGLHDVEIRRKGAGREQGELFLTRSGASPSANQLAREGDDSARVEVAALDDDITGRVTFLKMDIEGAEQDALLGCERMIREQHPKLAICTYHGYEDIWKIPLMIDCMYPGYQFYMRHYGGNLIPTEFVLLCKP